MFYLCLVSVFISSTLFFLSSFLIFSLFSLISSFSSFFLHYFYVSSSVNVFNLYLYLSLSFSFLPLLIIPFATFSVLLTQTHKHWSRWYTCSVLQHRSDTMMFAYGSPVELFRRWKTYPDIALSNAASPRNCPDWNRVCARKTGIYLLPLFHYRKSDCVCKMLLISCPLEIELSCLGSIKLFVAGTWAEMNC
jgi:hypothetical protein